MTALRTESKKMSISKKYNLLNLPDTIQFYQGHQTDYTYSAAGTKLKVVDKTAPEGVTLPVTNIGMVLQAPAVVSELVTDYVGNVIYENGVLKRILTPEGYWQDRVYYSYLKDHLGSVRAVVSMAGGKEVLAERNHYYPSGMRFGESALAGSVQPYRHGGFEMQAMHGLNYVDNLARERTVSIPGFTTMDPLCEETPWESPYAYCGNNPMRYVDPNGQEGVKYTDENGNKVVESNVVVLVEQKKAIPQNATKEQIAKIKKQNDKIEKRNNERIADVQTRLNATYNGSDGKGTKNSAGETVKFKFNVVGMETSDTKGGTTRQIREIAANYALKSSQKDVAGNNINALAAVVTTQSTRGSLGLSNGIYVTEASNAPQITISHEIGHTLKLKDNFPSSTGGLMDYPPGGLIPSEVDEIWEDAYER